MWFDQDPHEQDERYPYLPVDTGDPVGAAVSALAVLGALLVIAATLL